MPTTGLNKYGYKWKVNVSPHCVRVAVPRFIPRSETTAMTATMSDKQRHITWHDCMIVLGMLSSHATSFYCVPQTMTKL